MNNTDHKNSASKFLAIRSGQHVPSKEEFKEGIRHQDGNIRQAYWDLNENLSDEADIQLGLTDSKPNIKKAAIKAYLNSNLTLSKTQFHAILYFQDPILVGELLKVAHHPLPKNILRVYMDTPIASAMISYEHFHPSKSECMAIMHHKDPALRIALAKRLDLPLSKDIISEGLNDGIYSVMKAFLDRPDIELSQNEFDALVSSVHHNVKVDVIRRFNKQAPKAVIDGIMRSPYSKAKLALAESNNILTRDQLRDGILYTADPEVTKAMKLRLESMNKTPAVDGGIIQWLEKNAENIGKRRMAP